MTPSPDKKPVSQFALLRQRRFAPFFLTQFLGAFNDNVFKNALVVLLTFQAASWTTLAPGLLANLAAGIFILPFFLFSATAGQVADKFDRARLARGVKLLEIVIMLLAALGLVLHQLPVLLAALFLLGLHSTVFGPVKYAYLPQHLRESELIGGNALVEAATFVAILLGTLAGSLLAAAADGAAAIIGGTLSVAIVGYLAARSIPPSPAPVPALRINFNPLAATWANLAHVRRQRTVFFAIVGISWFWLYGALLLAQFPAYAKNVLGGDETAVTLLLLTFTLGIGIGSLGCERLSRQRIDLRLVAVGGLGMSVFGLDFAWASSALPTPGVPQGLVALLQGGAVWRVLFDLLLLGAAGGLYCVPLYALMQQRSEASHRARVIASNNILNALFMVVGALGAGALLTAGCGLPLLFALAAGGNGLALPVLAWVLPEMRQVLTR